MQQGERPGCPFPTATLSKPCSKRRCGSYIHTYLRTCMLRKKVRIIYSHIPSNLHAPKEGADHTFTHTFELACSERRCGSYMHTYLHTCMLQKKVGIHVPTHIHMVPTHHNTPRQARSRHNTPQRAHTHDHAHTHTHTVPIPNPISAPSP